MGVVVDPRSELGKELNRWNLPRNQFLKDPDTEELLKGPDGQPIRGMNCIGYEPYPRMMYKAQIFSNGKVSVGEVPPHARFFTNQFEYENQLNYVDSFNRSCQRIVHSEEQELIAKGQGWSYTQPEALELYEKQQQEIAFAAAQAEFKAKMMSEQAKREWMAAQDTTSHHVTDVVGGSKKRRGRKPKAVAPMATEDDDVIRGA